MSEGLLEDHAGAVGAASLGQLVHDRREYRRWDCHVERWSLGAAEFLAQRLERCRVRIVPPDIAHQATELLKCRGIESPALFQAAARTGLQLVETLRGPGHADDRHVETASLNHRL